MQVQIRATISGSQVPLTYTAMIASGNPTQLSKVPLAPVNTASLLGKGGLNQVFTLADVYSNQSFSQLIDKSNPSTKYVTYTLTRFNQTIPIVSQIVPVTVPANGQFRISVDNIEAGNYSLRLNLPQPYFQNVSFTSDNLEVSARYSRAEFV